MEELWGDLTDLDRAQGGIGDFESSEGFRYSHGSETYSVHSGLSKQGKVTFCCFLYKDNEIFESIVRRAVNLQEAEKEKYLDTLYEDCGITAEERAVGFSWPYWARQKCKADFYPPGPNQRKRHGKRHGNKKNRGNKKKQQVAHEEGSRYPPKLPPMHFNDLAARSMTSTAVNPKHSSFQNLLS